MKERDYKTYHYFIMTRFQQNFETYFEEYSGTELVLNVMLQVLQIIRKIHRSSLTYNDLKPSNVMIHIDETSADENASNPKVSLVDFGFVKRFYSSKKGHIGENEDADMFEGNMMFCSINQMNFY